MSEYDYDYERANSILAMDRWDDDAFNYNQPMVDNVVPMNSWKNNN